MTITDIAALLGVVFGTAGLVLGILNHLRDRPKVLVKLHWDMSVTDNLKFDPRKKWCLVTVTNCGRRPIYISHASLKLSKGYKYTHLLIQEAIRGEKLGEGDPPVSYVVSQDGLEEYKNDWHKIRAVVTDTAGRKYYSKVNKSKPPSWAM